MHASSWYKRVRGLFAGFSFPERLSRIAQRELENMGVEVRLDSRVNHIDERGAGVDGERIEARTVLWAAGVAGITCSDVDQGTVRIGRGA